MKTYNPSITWDPQVQQYLSHALGEGRLQRISSAIARPSLRTCLRANTLKITPQELLARLQQLFPGRSPYLHPGVPGAVIMPGRGPLQPDYDACGSREVLVNRLAAETVLKGAHVYAPGLLACSPGVAEGDLVAVAAALEQPGRRSAGINRGLLMTEQVRGQLLPSLDGLWLGVGRAVAGRRGMFRQQQGLVVEMQQRVFDIPPCNGVLPGLMMLQALPSIVAAQVLAPAPGSRVLDMCSAPGGKTCMLAEAMGDSGEVVALDRTAAKAAAVSSLAADMGLQSIRAFALDSTTLYQHHHHKQQQQQQQQQDQQEKEHEQEEAEEQAVECARPEGTCEAAARVGPAGEVQPPQCSASSTSSSTLEENSSSSSSSSCGQQLFCSSSNSSSSSRSDTGSAAATSSPASPPLQDLLQPGSFDHVLLDAPCSALGLRPRLLLGWDLHQLQQLAAYQRALLHSAVHMLRPGGTMVYCTCTINPGENEANVAYALQKFPQLQLVAQEPCIGGPGLVGQGLLSNQHQAQLVQRFDPGSSGPGSEDSIGFFVAKFVKSW